MITKITLGDFYLAEEKIVANCFSLSPTSPLIINGIETEIKWAEHSVATALASIVLPVPKIE